MVQRAFHWRFVPRLWPTLATALLLSVLMSLGFWQLDRARQKRELHAEFSQRQALAPMDLNTAGAIKHAAPEMLWRPVTATGTFEEQTHILLDNQVVGRSAGYFVYTPLRLTGGDEWILVNRGWLPIGDDRRFAPVFPKTSAQVTIRAIAKAPPLGGIRLRKTHPEQLGPAIYRVQRLDLEQSAALMQRAVLPYVLRLTPESEHGFRTQWRIPGSGEERHLGYAFQWFALAATLAVIYVWLSFENVGRRPGQAGGSSGKDAKTP